MLAVLTTHVAKGCSATDDDDTHGQHDAENKLRREASAIEK